MVSRPPTPPHASARCRGRLRGLRHLQVRDPAKRAAAIVKATTFYDDPKIIADASRNLGEAMVGINDTLPETERYANRGW